MQATPTLSFTNRARADIARITTELTDLQRQTASGKRVEDLQGLGSGATRALNATTLIAQDDNRIELLKEVNARVGMQTTSLQLAGEAVTKLAKSVRDAAITGDGNYVGPDLEFGFASLTSAMNQTFNGQAIFGGDRTDRTSVTVGNLSDLTTVSQPDEMFDVSSRRQRIDLGPGASFELGDNAKDLTWTTYQAMRDLQVLLDSAGGKLGASLTTIQTDALNSIAERLSQGATNIRQAEGKNGLIEARIQDLTNRFEARGNMMRNEVALQTEADLAEVALRLSSLQTQYQATAQTFSQLSKMTLLDFLR
jgi:flagellar hook-associated protein 3 FlgL